MNAPLLAAAASSARLAAGAPDALDALDAEWRRLDREMRARGYPAIHHSPEYENARRPAYRVLPAAQARPLLAGPAGP